MARGAKKCYLDNNKPNIEYYLSLYENEFQSLSYFNLTIDDDYKGMRTKVYFKCEHKKGICRLNDITRKRIGCSLCRTSSEKNQISPPRYSNEEELRKLCCEKFPEINHDEIGYISSRHKIYPICSIHGKFEVYPKNYIQTKRKKGCIKCNKEYTKWERFFQKVSKKFPNYKDIYSYDNSIFTNCLDIISVSCSTHGPFNVTVYEHYNGSGCPKCKREEVGNLFIDKCKDTYPDIDYSISTYTMFNEPIDIICKVHGKIKIYINKNYLNKENGCPKCIKKRYITKGEERIMNYLDNNDIRYIYEYMIPGTRYRFDFFLPTHNVYIEYHGIQHYEPIELWGGEKALLETKKRDDIKKTISIEEKRELIEIPYWDFEEIENILKDKL